MKTTLVCPENRGLRFLIKMTIFYSMAFISCQKENDAPPIILTKAVYVADENSGSVSVIDAVNGKRVKTIQLVDGLVKILAHNVQVAPDGKSVWVTGVPYNDGHSHGGEEQVIVIDPFKYTIIKRINVGSGQHLAHVVLDGQSKFAYVTSNESNQVIKIDAHTYSIVSRFNLGANHGPHGLRCFGDNLFIANMLAKNLLIINIPTGQIEELALGGIAVQTAITPDGNLIFVSLYDTREVAMYNILSKKIIKIQLPAGSEGPIQLYPTPDSKFIYVCDQGGLEGRPVSNKIYVIDVASSTVINTINVGNKAHGIVIDKEGNNAFVTNSGDNTVSIINISTQMVVNTIPVGMSPNGISYWFSENGITGGMP